MKKITCLQELAEIVKPGDVVFSMNHSNGLSKLMSGFMRSRWSHSILVADNDEDALYTLETSSFEVWYGDLSEYLKPEYDFQVWSPVNADDRFRSNRVNRARQHRGETYGYLQLLGFAFRCLLQRFEIEYLNPIRMGVVCCGVIFYAYQGSGIEELEDHDPESRHTQDLFEIMSSCGKFIPVAYKPEGLNATFGVGEPIR